MQYASICIYLTFTKEKNLNLNALSISNHSSISEFLVLYTVLYTVSNYEYFVSFSEETLQEKIK